MTLILMIICTACILFFFACFIAIQCPPGMVYQQCGSLCLHTCTNNITSDCHGGCAEGCFCPDGLVLSNGRCVDPIVCPGTYIKNYFVIGLCNNKIL